jgi:hypothetical protein
VRPRVWAPVVLALLLTGCTDDDPTPSPAPSTSSPSESREPTSTSEPTDSPGPTRPAVLDWRRVPGSVDDEVTVSGDWLLRRLESGDRVELTGPRQLTIDPPTGFRITDALIDGSYAVVVAEHERAEQPNRATVVDLSTGERSVVDGRSDVPTTVGGTWALGSGLLVHATTSGRDYCVAVLDLLTGRGERGPCVPPRHGLTNATVSPGGVSVMTFDDSRPSCRTLERLVGSRFEPIAGVEECRGWEAVTTESAAIWGLVANERRVEASEFFADGGSGPVEIGPGTTGTLTWCGDAAYVVRDPQRDDDPARLLRIDIDGSVEVVYESPGTGRAFLSAPRCGATDLTVTAFTAEGDEQVTAPIG